jgi:hypothetical protein
LSDTIDTSAVDAWVRGDVQQAQAIADANPIPDDGAPAARLSGEIPAYLENHLAVQNLEQKRTPDPAQAEGAMITRAASKLSELGTEGQALVAEWGGHTSPDFKENLSYAREAFKDIVANRPDLIAKVDASGLGNDPAVLKFLAEHGRARAHTLGDYTVSSRRTSYDEPSRPSSNSAAQRELNRIFEETPPGTAGYAKPSVQRRITQLQEMIHGDGPAVGLAGRTV